jgi:hypothetical protein
LSQKKPQINPYKWGLSHFDGKFSQNKKRRGRCLFAKSFGVQSDRLTVVGVLSCDCRLSIRRTVVGVFRILVSV